MKKSAGVIIILNNEKVLLGHPSNASWVSTFSFPKGGIDKDESKIKAALRELKEETSVCIKKDLICNKEEPIVVEYKDKKGVIYKKLYLYLVHISCISEIGLESEVIPKKRLQLEEMDWAGFMTKEEANEKIFYRFKHLLEVILKKNETYK